MSEKALVLLSGGLDSTVLLYQMMAEHGEVAALSFFYGQRHIRELDSASRISRLLNIRHDVINVSPIYEGVTEGCGSLLDRNTAVPEGHYEDVSMKATVVPNRNMILLSVAAARAIALKIPRIAYAAHSGDHAIYPDCRLEFATAMKVAISLCDWSPLELVTPFVDQTKAQIVGIGHSLHVPFDQTWSCYKGEDVHCGVCGTCVERREAFSLAGVADPTVYSL